MCTPPFPACANARTSNPTLPPATKVRCPPTSTLNSARTAGSAPLQSGASEKNEDPANHQIDTGQDKTDEADTLETSVVPVPGVRRDGNVCCAGGGECRRRDQAAGEIGRASCRERGELE